MVRDRRAFVGAVSALSLVVATIGGPSIAFAQSDASCEVTIWGDEITHLSLADAAAAYEAETGVKVNMVGKSFDTMFTDYETQVPAGTGPDAIIAYQTNMQAWAESGIAAPVEIADKLAEFEPVAANSVMFNGKAYSVPLWIENIALIRNTDLAPTAPATMDELVKMGQGLVAAGKAELPISIALNPYILYPIATSMGAPYFTSNADGTYNFSEPQFSSPGGLAYANKLSEWAKSGVLNPNVDGGIALDRFQTGKSPFLVTGPWDIPTIKASGVPYVVETIPPTGDLPAAPWAGIAGLILNPKGACALAANDFATRFMTTKDAQVSVFKIAAYPPALTAALAEVGADPDVKGFGEAGQHSTPLIGNSAVGKAINPLYGQTLQAILKGDDAAALWTDMATTIEAALKADTSIPATGN